VYDILLVDDNDADANIFEVALREGNSRAKIYWLANGEEALQFLRRTGRFADVGTVKIVVLDVHMPLQDGFEVLRQIKSDPNLNRVPVVMLTSAASRDDIDLAYSLGANAYFKKPTTLQSYVELLRVLAQHWLDLAHLPSASGFSISDPASKRQRLESTPNEL
jgi:chemotaxis family two-component system response regulator Rcp1